MAKTLGAVVQKKESGPVTRSVPGYLQEIANQADPTIPTKQLSQIDNNTFDDLTENDSFTPFVDDYTDENEIPNMGL